MPVRGWLLGLLLIASTAPACESDHGALAKGATSTGGVAGSGGRAASGGTQGGFTTIPQTGGTKATGTGGRAPDEIPGENVLTFMHGIVDAPRVLVCFVAGRGADARVLDELPTELGYGESLTRRALEGASFVKDDLEPVVIAGELELVSALDCSQALKIARAEQDAAPTLPGDSAGAGGSGAGGASPSAAGAGANAGEPGAGASAGGPGSGSGGANGTDAGGAGGEGGEGPLLPDPPRLRVGDLPIVPAGTFNTGRSYLLVGNGCIGGPAFGGKYARQACGDSYSPTSPTLSAVLVALSRRTEYAKLGLQVVHASVATSIAGMTASRVLTTDFQPIVGGVELIVSSDAYGANSGFWQVEVQELSVTTFVERWSVIKARAGIASLDDGWSYTLVLLGPNAGLTRKGFWNSPAIGLVQNDPTRVD
jgi:hypothetical protein